MHKIVWYSNSFYAYSKGYKMHLCVDAAGNSTGKGTHVSGFLNLIEGPHYNELTWPLSRGESLK